MTLSLELRQLVACGIAPTQAREFLTPLWAACRRFEITTPARLAGFLANACVESKNLSDLEENLFYRTPERVRQVFPTRVPSLAEAAKFCRAPEALANRVYSLKNGNGDEASGDGWRFRGRGIFQLTGRHNYADAGQALGLDLIASPGDVAKPLTAALTAGWFWHVNKCNLLADASNWDAITRAVNGPAMLHRADRAQRAAENLEAFR